MFFILLLVTFVTGSEYCVEPTDAECQDVEDIGGRHIHNRWPCDCQKYWWCEDGKLKTAICTPWIDGTEQYVRISGFCVNVADAPIDICNTDENCDLPTNGNCTSFTDGLSDIFPLPCNCHGYWYCDAGEVYIYDDNCGEGTAFVPNSAGYCVMGMDSSYCKKPLISTSSMITTSVTSMITTTSPTTTTTATSPMTTTTTAINCTYLEGRIWDYNEKTDTIMQVTDASDKMDCVVQCFYTGCDAVSIFKEPILNHLLCILHHAPKNILECEDCAGYLIPDRFNLDLVKFGYTGGAVDTVNEIECWLQCSSRPDCNYYTFKNTSFPEQVGTCYLIQDNVEASPCDSCFSGSINCIEN